MQPRPQQGTSLLANLQLLATDEGTYVVRVAWRDPGSDSILVAYDTKVMWQGGSEDVEHFASVIAATINDVVEWVVS